MSLTPATPEPAPSRPYVRRLLWKAGGCVLLLTMLAGAVNALQPVERKLGWGFFGNDLMPSYTAGTFVRDGRVDELYNPYAVKRTVREIWTATYPHEPASKGLAPWLNPPFFAWAFVPLARLPYLQALSVWIGINVALTVASCLLLTRLLPTGAPRSARWLVPLLVVVSFPYLQVVCHQQNTFISLTILASALLLTFKAIKNRSTIADDTRPHWDVYAAGMVCGLLCFKPQLAAVVTVALGVVLGYRAVLGAMMTGALLLAVGEWTLPGSLAEFVLRMPETVRLVQERENYHWSRQTTVLSFWRMLLQGSTAGPAWDGVKLLSTTCVTAIVASLAWSATLAWRAADLQTARRWLAAAICAMPLVMPYYMDYDLLLLAAPVTLFATDVLSRGGRLSRADHWAVRGWLVLAAWMVFEPAGGRALQVNVNVILLTALAGMMIRRVGATDTTGLTGAAGATDAPGAPGTIVSDVVGAEPNGTARKAA